MKTTQTMYSDPKLERYLAQRDKEHKKLARRLGKHNASRNLPHLLGDFLISFIGPIKAAYEADAAYIAKYLQPQTLAPSLKLEAEHKGDRDKTLEGNIKEKTAQNQNDRFELEDFNPSNVGARVRLVLILTLLLLTGETVWNTASFQFTGVNLLFSLLLSLMLSLAVFIFAHLVPMLYKHLTSKIKQRILLVASTLGITLVFYVMAIFRSMYLAHYGVVLSPGYFILINLFFYSTSALLSYFLLPEWEEIMEHWHHLRRQKNIKKKDKEIKGHEKERQQLRDDAHKNTEEKMKLAAYVKDLLDLTKCRYAEAVEIFKSINLTYRTDRLTPDCFQQTTPPPDIDPSGIPLIN